MPDPEVDSFGRVVQKRRREDDDHSAADSHRDSHADDTSHSHVRDSHRDSERGGEYRRRPPPRSRDWAGGGAGGRGRGREWSGRGYGHAHHGDGDRARSYDHGRRHHRDIDYNNSRGRPPPRYDGHGGHGSFRSARSASPPRFNRPRLDPMKSYKNFILTQPDDDAPPEEFQRRYNEYRIQYTKDMSNYFFEKNKCEEWFRERYDPLVQQNMEAEARAWAAKESQRIHQMIVDNPVAAVESFRLYMPDRRGAVRVADTEEAPPPPPEASVEGKEVNSVHSDSAEAQMDQTKDYNKEDRDTVVSSAPGPSNTPSPGVHSAGTAAASPASGHHFDGHRERTLYLTGIPATCSRAILAQAVKAALAHAASNNSPVGSLERLSLAQPTWNSRLGRQCFDRTAWVTLSEDCHLPGALRCLRDLRIPIPGPVPSDSTTGEPAAGISFKLQCTIHTVKELAPLPDLFSATRRVGFDTVRAIELASLLDEERGVPTESNLATTLGVLLKMEKEQGTDGPLKLQCSDKLDIAVAYLRRVHFFVYYSGKRFRDEAHLLAMSSGVVMRSAPTIAAPSNPSQTKGQKRSRAGSAEEDTQASEVSLGEEGTEETGVESRPQDSDPPAGDNTDSEPTGTGESVTAAGTDVDVAAGTDVDVATAADESVANSTDEAVGVEEVPGATPPVAIRVVKVDVTRPFRGRSNPASINLDNRVADFIVDLRRRVARKQQSIETDGVEQLPRTVDEEDALAISRAQEKVMEQVTNENCNMQPDGKARCGLVWCNKLFKSKEFLSKHIKNKHPDVALERLVRVAEQYMSARFNAEDLVNRPLPPIDVETSAGLELHSVKDVYEDAQSRLVGAGGPVQHIVHVLPSVPGGGAISMGAPHMPLPGGQVPPPPQYHQMGGGRRSGGRGRGRGRGFDYGFDDRERDRRRFSGDFPRERRYSDVSEEGSSGGRGIERRPPQRHSFGDGGRGQVPRPSVEYQPPKPEDNNSRRLHSYLDVDAPMDVSVDLDYGVTVMPPPKKRKLVAKTN
mmetsp:Transcript_22792/g.33284  ORF Transcript_22792/g.33284 Transcript_22792/m.33284 type:complete len:1021 (-) Transcript_22792:386-3448(-)